jgi:transposase
MKKGQIHRHFNREFKLGAVQLVTEKGMPVGTVARELDIHPNLLHTWRRRYLAEGDKAFIGKGCADPQEVEVKRLRKELDRVKEELAILKKAAAFFAKKSR